jgi:hypothetical protein
MFELQEPIPERSLAEVFAGADILTEPSTQRGQYVPDDISTQYPLTLQQLVLLCSGSSEREGFY